MGLKLDSTGFHWIVVQSWPWFEGKMVCGSYTVHEVLAENSRPFITSNSSYSNT
jgi:hypothetical protein